MEDQSAASGTVGAPGPWAASDRRVHLAVEGAVAVVVLDRQEALNALDEDTKLQLLQALEAAATAPEVRTVLLRASGRAFCVGQDLKEHRERLSISSRDAADFVADTLERHYSAILTVLLTMPKPTVVAIQGPAAGAGWGLALACDIRIATPQASFTAAFTRVGLIPDTGLSWALPREIGLGRARRALLTNRVVSADEALDWGMLDEVVEGAELAERALAVATELAEGCTTALVETRRLLLDGATGPWRLAMYGENAAQPARALSQEHAQAIARFFDQPARGNRLER